ncbi:MAG TPA: hypothetical protein VFA60_11035 [Terriglobales bacterium]|nr:hypothetical protein [Terriglobales bacterium]
MTSFALRLYVCAATILSLAATCLAQTPAQSNTPPPVPDHAAYARIFHEIAVLKGIADEAQKKGDDRSNLRSIVRKEARLSESEGAVLERIALQCEADLAALDARAQVIINKYLERYPYGIVNSSIPMAPPPPELKPMQTERNNLVLLARDRLRNELGEDSFAKFDRYVKKDVTETQATSPAR